MVKVLLNIKKEPIPSSKTKSENHNDIIKKKKVEKKKEKIKNISNKKKSVTKKNIEKLNSMKSRVLKEKKYIPSQDNNIIEIPNNLRDNKNTIRIGVLLPLSGKNSEIGNMILNALELAIFQNKESTIELVIKDTQTEPSFSKKAFQQLLDKKINFEFSLFFAVFVSVIAQYVAIIEKCIYQINILIILFNENY